MNDRWFGRVTGSDLQGLVAPSVALRIQPPKASFCYCWYCQVTPNACDSICALPEPETEPIWKPAIVEL